MKQDIKAKLVLPLDFEKGTDAEEMSRFYGVNLLRQVPTLGITYAQSMLIPEVLEAETKSPDTPIVLGFVDPDSLLEYRKTPETKVIDPGSMYPQNTNLRNLPFDTIGTFEGFSNPYFLMKLVGKVRATENVFGIYRFIGGDNLIRVPKEVGNADNLEDALELAKQMATNPLDFDLEPGNAVTKSLDSVMSAKKTTRKYAFAIYNQEGTLRGVSKYIGGS